tara:strand:- start:61 stop:318 length:258 start_codon:yes stop_codon:yes gene_type:complete
MLIYNQYVYIYYGPLATGIGITANGPVLKQLNEGIIMLYVIKWVLLAICSALGMALIPTMATTGFVLAFGCFLVLALDIARQFID